MELFESDDAEFGGLLGEGGRDASILDPAIDVLVRAAEQIGKMDDGFATFVVRRASLEQEFVERAECIFHGVQRFVELAA